MDALRVLLLACGCALLLQILILASVYFILKMRLNAEMAHWQQHAKPPAAHVTQAQIDEYAPEKVYESKAVQDDEENGDMMDCVICIEEITDGQVVRELPCSHEFHSECITPWLAKKSRCPLCKQSVFPVPLGVDDDENEEPWTDLDGATEHTPADDEVPEPQRPDEAGEIEVYGLPARNPTAVHVVVA